MNINFLPKEFRSRSFLKKIATKRVQSIVVLTLLGILSLGLIQNHSSIENSAVEVTSHALAQNYAVASTNIDNVIFGSNPNPAEVNQILDKQAKLITTRPTFLAALQVVQKNESVIKKEADATGVPLDVAIGIALLENGGSESATSVAGARGIYQFMPSTARNYNLVVTSYQDDRLDPAKSAHAAMAYLNNSYQILHDWGLAIWSYHAGAGNVCHAVQIYAAARGQSISGCADQVGNFVTANKLTVNQLLSDPSVQNQLSSKLKDDSAGYAYKVMTDAHIYQLAKSLGTDELVKRVSLLNSQNLDINRFFAS